VALTKQLDRHLGFVSVYSIAVGAMLGSGIFVLPGLAAAVAGPWVALSYMLAGLLVLPALLSKAELATAMPVAGGTYVYVDRSMGPWAGTVAGLGTWLALSAKSAFALVGLGSYLVLFADVPVTLVACGILLGLLAVNVLGAGKASAVQIAIVSVSILALLVLIGQSAWVSEASLREPAFPMGSAGIVAGAGFVFVSYNGVTKICSIAEEVRNPDRNIPLGMLAAQASVMTLYALIAWALTGNVPLDRLAGDVTPIATLGGTVFGTAGLYIFGAVAIAGLISMCNAGVLSTTRFPFAMARDGLVPPLMARLSPRFGTPVPAIALTGVLLVALVTVLPVEKLAKLASGFTIFIFCIVNLAVIVLRESGARWYKPSFRSPLYPWTQIAGILGGVWLVTQLGSLVLWGVGGAVLLGTVWYFAYARARVDRRGALSNLVGEAHVLEATTRFEAEEEAEEHPPRVIVPVFGHEPTPGHLLRLAAGFVDEGVLEVLRLEEIPQAVALTSHIRADETMERLARQAEVVGQDLHLDVEFHDLVTHNAWEALVHHARLTRAEWIVMEPQRSELRSLIRFPMAWWLDNLPCDVALLTEKNAATDEETTQDPLDGATEEVRSQPFQRILVLAEPGPYDSIVVRVADELARKARGEITLFRALGPEEDRDLDQQVRRYHDQLSALCTVPTHSLVRRTTEAAHAIAELSERFDLIVLGAPDERSLRTLLMGSEEHRLIEAASCSVLTVKAPRHKVHHRLSATEDRYELAPILRAGVVMTGLDVKDQHELFAEMGRHLGAKAGIDPKRVERALWRRERRQTTGLLQGVSLSAPNSQAVDKTLVGVFTLSQPVRFGAPNSARVSVCVVCLGSDRDRRFQLRVLAQLSERIIDGQLLEELRGSADAEQVITLISSPGASGRSTEG
jgi:APA family basic amino acid/polyamine antiporter